MGGRSSSSIAPSPRISPRAPRRRGGGQPPGIPWCGEEFDFIAYFSRNPLFAEVWSHYRLSAEWDRYQVYTRKD